MCYNPSSILQILRGVPYLFPVGILETYLACLSLFRGRDGVYAKHRLWRGPCQTCLRSV